MNRTCPYCKADDCEAEWVDVGVGLVQSGPYVCRNCGASEIGVYDKKEVTSEEKNSGWYYPNNHSEHVSTIGGVIIHSKDALLMYQAGLVDKIPFNL